MLGHLVGSHQQGLVAELACQCLDLGHDTDHLQAGASIVGPRRPLAQSAAQGRQQGAPFFAQMRGGWPDLTLGQGLDQGRLGLFEKSRSKLVEQSTHRFRCGQKQLAVLRDQGESRLHMAQDLGQGPGKTSQVSKPDLPGRLRQTMRQRDGAVQHRPMRLQSPLGEVQKKLPRQLIGVVEKQVVGRDVHPQLANHPHPILGINSVTARQQPQGL